ncbi:MAG: polyprenyl diphosphate synthase [Clostridium sp.]|nr:polyprenyl diphosphate synthase [Clostridium sp.]MCM1444767.1 polyprenyl diphosphate synthase [Candidatus Amulumruptor caecigallinarius]
MDYSNLKVPNHVAIILDGNGRWAKERGLSRSKGHLKGYENLKDLSFYILSKGVKILSVFAFSTENFKRSEEEVDFLMNLFIDKFKKDSKFFKEKNIKVIFSGRKSSPLPKKVIEAMNYLESETIKNTNGILNICINYGGHAEIIDTVKKVINDINNNKFNIDNLNEETFSKYLYNDLEPIDLLIRTSGEYRVSNFMLWQLAYSELYFTSTYFPDFKQQEFDKAILEYSKRDRRFGGIKYEEKSN